MSNFTLNIEDVLDYFCYMNGVTHDNTPSDIVEKGYKLLFDFEYPFYDENKRSDFEKLFCDNFYLTEIGSETSKYFQHRLKVWLKINMPFYNKLFLADEIEYDPLINYVMETDRKINELENKNKKLDRSDKNDRKSNYKEGNDQKTDGNSKNRTLESNNPVDRLVIKDNNSIITGATGIEENEGTYGNTLKIDKNIDELMDSILKRLETETNNRDMNNILNEFKKGKIGNITYQEMIVKYRESIVNTNELIFKDMRKKLFLGVY